MLRALELRSALLVPMRAPTRIVGVMTLLTAESHRRLDGADLELAEQLAHRAAVAVENARLHTTLANVAEILQRSLLPDELPEIPGWELASLYRPAGADRRVDVGGDFYEFFATVDGWTCLVGDVTGKGVDRGRADRGDASWGPLREPLRARPGVDPRAAGRGAPPARRCGAVQRAVRKPALAGDGDQLGRPSAGADRQRRRRRPRGSVRRPVARRVRRCSLAAGAGLCAGGRSRAAVHRRGDRDARGVRAVRVGAAAGARVPVGGGVAPTGARPAGLRARRVPPGTPPRRRGRAGAAPRTG